MNEYFWIVLSFDKVNKAFLRSLTSQMDVKDTDVRYTLYQWKMESMVKFDGWLVTEEKEALWAQLKRLQNSLVAEFYFRDSSGFLEILHNSPFQEKYKLW